MIIEKVIADFLKTKNIPGILTNVYMEKPVEDVQEYILIMKTGNHETNLINHPTLAIQSISKVSLYRAAVINEAVKEAMKAAKFETAVFQCDLNSDYNFTNTATKEYRYQAVYNLTY